MEALAVDNHEEISQKQNDLKVENDKIETDPFCEIRQHYFNLSGAFLEQVSPGIKVTEEKLKNVARNQRVLMESLKQENEKFSARSKLENIEISMKLIEHYRAKLLTIKKDMKNVEESSKRVLRGATHLEHLKETAQLKEDDRKKREILAEKELLAKFEKS